MPTATKTAPRKTSAPDVTLPTLLPGSDMPNLHRDNGPLGDALRSIPAWVSAARDLARLTAARPERRNVATPEVEIEAYLENALADGADIDLDALTDYARTVTAELAVMSALHHGFEAAVRQAANRLDETLRDHRQEIHAHLTAQLVDVVEDARDRADAIGLTAEQAIAAGLVDAYQELGDVLLRFRRLRTAASALNTRLGWNITHAAHAAFPELMWISNPTDVFEHWRAWHVDGALVNPRDDRDRRPLTPPWPEVTARGDEGLRGWFVFLARTPDAEPWLPTPEQYDAAAKELADYAADLRPAPKRRTKVEEIPGHPGYAEDTKRPARHARAGSIR